MITLPASILTRWFSLWLLVLTGLKIPGSDTCGIRNLTFMAGESIDFKVYYSVAGTYLAAGQASFATTLEVMNNKPVYHITALGSTLPFYDHFFKVRDRYESYIDTLTLQPYKFIRNVAEGTYKKFEQVAFNKTTNTAITNAGCFHIPVCVQDVISAMYYARNVDYTVLKNGDKIPFTLFLGDELYSLYIRYAGRETITTRYGTFQAIKVRPLLLKGAEFSGGETMNVWISDDANRIPLRIESAISVGSVKADMMGFSNLRYPLTALIRR
ncbi:MAG: DUF3108 domain-containing protein [Chitinophagaceae bacterium]|nr:DUF3108 domain-containing protein [Chitinophagaceae bacterium]